MLNSIIWFFGAFIWFVAAGIWAYNGSTAFTTLSVIIAIVYVFMGYAKLPEPKQEEQNSL